MRTVITIRKFMKHLSKKRIKHGKTSMLQLIYGLSWYVLREIIESVSSLLKVRRKCTLHT